MTRLQEFPRAGEEEPWPFVVGPDLPELRKDRSTAPFNWTACWGNYRHAHWAALELEAVAAVKARGCCHIQKRGCCATV